MAVKKKAASKARARKQAAKKAGKKTGRKRPAASRKRLTPRKEKRGLEDAEILLDPASPETRELVAQVEAAGGVAIGAYREPFSGRPVLLASLPLAAVEPTPFQRDLSPTHTKRLAQKMAASVRESDLAMVAAVAPSGSAE
jgi:ParB family chromosome partitioning protein